MNSMPIAPLVVFLDILDQYSFNDDLTCKFKFNSNYKPEGRDNVAIFKLGWNNVTEYVAIRCLPEILGEEISCVTFSRHVLPKNIVDLYQICYINGQDLRGASTPFQFYAEDNLMVTSDSFPSKVFTSFDSITKYQIFAEKDEEISRLKEENGILRESLKTLLATKTERNSKDYDKDINEVKNLVESLKSMLLDHDKDIIMLKRKIVEGGEEYKKLYLEKYRLQKKYEKLKNAYFDRKPLHEDNQQTNDFNLDLGDLKSMPPFPSILKN